MIPKYAAVLVFSVASLVGCASSGTNPYNVQLASTADLPACPAGSAPGPAEPIWGLGGPPATDTVWGLPGPPTDTIWHTGGKPVLVWWDTPKDESPKFAAGWPCRPAQ